MATNSRHVVLWSLGLVLTAGCQREGTSNPGSGGVGWSGSGSGGREPVPELCSLSGTCTNGKFSGRYGPFCVPLEVACEYGCRNPQGALPEYRGDDGALASRLAHQAFCEAGDGSVPPPADARPDGATCQPQLVNGYDTGFDTCADGALHRRRAVTCVGAPEHPSGGLCGKDTDCAAGAICLCASSGVAGGQCTPSGCATELDCPTGRGCIATVRAERADTCAPAGRISFDCQTPDDACATDADCGDSSATPRECRLVGDRRVCGCKQI